MNKEGVIRGIKESFVKPINLIKENPVRIVTLGLVRRRPVRKIHLGTYISKM